MQQFRQSVIRYTAPKEICKSKQFRVNKYCIYKCQITKAVERDTVINIIVLLPENILQNKKNSITGIVSKRLCLQQIQILIKYIPIYFLKIIFSGLFIVYVIIVKRARNKLIVKQVWNKPEKKVKDNKPHFLAVILFRDFTCHKNYIICYQPLLKPHES